MDLSQYRGLFLDEARRHLKIAEGLLVADELSDNDLSTLFRVFHTLKGMAATMSVAPLSMLAQSLERFVGEARDGAFRPNEASTDLLGEGLEALYAQLAAIEEGREPPPSDDFEDRLRKWLITGSVSTFTCVEDTRDAVTETSTEAPEVEPIDRSVLACARGLAACQILRAQATLEQRTGLLHVEASISHMWRGLLAVREVSFSRITPSIRRQLQALARRYRRRVHFEVQGDDAATHEALLPRLELAVVGLLRQVVAQGFESEAARLECGKDPVGTIRLTLRHLGNALRIEIQDDGNGRVAMPPMARFAGSRPPESREGDPVSQPQHGLRGPDQVRNIVDSLAGRLTVSGQPGVGVLRVLEVPLPARIVEIVEVDVGGHTLGIPKHLLEGNPVETSRETPSLLGLPAVGTLGLKALDGGRVRVDRVKPPSQAMVLQAPFPLHRLEGVLGLMMVPDGTLAFVVRPVP